MHPKAALLALHGFKYFLLAGQARIKAGEVNGEIVLRHYSARWDVTESTQLISYDPDDWECTDTAQWDSLPQELIDELIERQTR